MPAHDYPPELLAYIDDRLTAAYHQRWVDLGWWCPRCNVEAPPLDDTAQGAPGWCGLCGLDPLADGPAQNGAQLRGITA